VFQPIKLILVVVMILSVASCACGPKTYKQVLPRQSFVKIEKNLSIKACEESGECMETSFSAVASGVVVQNTMRGAYVLTAAHVCDESDVISKWGDNAEIKFNFHVVTLNEDKKSVEIVAFDNKHDVCIVWVKDLFLQPVTLAPRAPEPGDTILNIAAPLGVFAKNMVPIFQGFYNGIDENQRAVYSLPAFGGSSGSPIFNERGELIGMVHSTLRYFNHIALSPNYNFLREFMYRTIDQHMSHRFFRILWSPFMGIGSQP
jgi:S1-C subfamily serine protease